MAPHVLLSVEDSDADFDIIKIAMDECDVQVCRVFNGEQGIWFLQKAPGFETAPRPDLILLDVNLPKKNGFEVLIYIRSIESLRAIPVVMFTSSALAS